MVGEVVVELMEGLEEGCPVALVDVEGVVGGLVGWWSGGSGGGKVGEGEWREG